jgi:hypothetical protein
LTQQRMGLGKREQPLRGKESIGPAKLNHLPPFTPCSRAVNIRSVQTVGSVHAQRARTSPACVTLAGTSAGVSSIGLSFPSPPSCAPFAPLPLRSFTATMVPLTPACRSALRLPQCAEPELPLARQVGLPDSRVRPS